MALLYPQLILVEELEVEEERNRVRLFRRSIRDAQDPFQISEQQFKMQFRLNQEASRDLVNALNPFMNHGIYTSRIPAVFRVLSVLHFLAVGSYQRSVGCNMLACLSQTVVSRSIAEVTNIIVRHLMKIWIRFPRNAQERNEYKQLFQIQQRMPHILGVVDGTHVAIVKPRENENIYVNRKGYHSLNCQIICDANMKIINLVARWPGSTHDAFVWRSSRIGQVMRGNYENGDEESKIMGDSGYACLPWLLVPLPNPATPREERYNIVCVLSAGSGQRPWESKNPINQKRLIENSPASFILKTKAEKDYSFDLHLDAEPESKRKGFLRFQTNPLPYWGPGTRATAMIGEKMVKSVKNQGKRKHGQSDESVQKQLKHD